MKIYDIFKGKKVNNVKKNKFKMKKMKIGGRGLME